MNRRDFLKSTAVAAVISTATIEAEAVVRRRRPNILYVFSNQHRACSLPGEPFNQALAPTIAAFRQANCSMEQCTSNYPLCSPYRAIFMSGLYPQQSGVMGNVEVLDPKVGPLGETFRKAGYHTGYVGKWHIHGQDAVGREDGEFIPKGPYRMGFEDWRIWANTNDHWHSWTLDQETGEKIFPEGWQPARMTDEAIGFLEAQPHDKPWLLVLSWNPPHPPFDPPDDDPGGRTIEGEGGGRRGGGESACPPYRGIRTRTHTYVVAATGRWLLYDNVADPYQLRNLVDDPAHASLMESFDAKLACWLHAVGDPFPLAAATKSVFTYAWCPNPDGVTT